MIFKSYAMLKNRCKNSELLFFNTCVCPTETTIYNMCVCNFFYYHLIFQKYITLTDIFCNIKHTYVNIIIVLKNTYDFG